MRTPPTTTRPTASAPSETGAADGGPADVALWPARVRTVHLGWASGRVDLRVVGVTAALLLVALAVAVWSMSRGSASIGFGDVVAAFAGQADQGTTRVVLEWRLPRILFALVAGAALAMAGAVFQSVTRNPLGSPDIIGFSVGAFTGALLVAAVGLGSAVATPLGALAGGLGTGVVVYLLAGRSGAGGMRIIIVGIGVSAFLGAINTYLLTRLSLETAIVAAGWSAGSLNDVGWTQTLIVVGATLLVLPLLLGGERSLSLLEMGEDSAAALGVSGERVRLPLLLAAVLLVSLVTAAAGPIAFISLAAPQLAMRLTGSSGVRLLPAAAMGGLLLVASDLVARSVVESALLPVGVVTLSIGGAYLLWLLIRTARRTA